jgi:hypothetical protein
VVLGKQAISLRRVILPVTFRDASNYSTETLTFLVVDFSEPYHIILGWLLAVLKPTRLIRKRTDANCSSFHLRVFLGLSNL